MSAKILPAFHVVCEECGFYHVGWADTAERAQALKTGHDSIPCDTRQENK